ncbi:hypothetical protein MRB53_042263 [Persea americana]|nr:hypothetical protein MRB53_042263 [Persea americana]
MSDEVVGRVCGGRQAHDERIRSARGVRLRRAKPGAVCFVRGIDARRQVHDCDQGLEASPPVVRAAMSRAITPRQCRPMDAYSTYCIPLSCATRKCHFAGDHPTPCRARTVPWVAGTDGRTDSLALAAVCPMQVRVCVWLAYLHTKPPGSSAKSPHAG